MSKLQRAILIPPMKAPPPPPVIVATEQLRGHEARLSTSLEADSCGCWSFFGRLLIWATRNNG